MTSRSKSAYGIGLRQFSVFVNRWVGRHADSWMDVAFGLALALGGLQRMILSGTDLKYRQRDLILPHLEAAWREFLFLRSRTDDLDESILTRYGRLNYKLRPLGGDFTDIDEED